MWPGKMMAALFTMCVATTNVMGLPNRVSRQTSDTTNISGDQLICLLQGNCNNRTPVLPTQSDCTCVKWWQCNDNDITEGEGLSVVVNLRSTVACTEDINDICCNNFDRSKARPQPERTPQSCGQRNVNGVGAKFEGFSDNQAQFGEFPWMAAVLRMSVDETAGIPIYVCGASLVHPRLVLTVAHNVQDKQPQDLLVRVGEWDFKNPTESIVHQDIRVRNIVIHPNYDPRNVHYDVALLLLENEAQLGPTVQTICLPNPFQIFDGARCFSSGWGKNVFSENGKYQQILKSVDLPVVNRGLCENTLRSHPRLGPSFTLHESFICAGGEPDKDMCTGDGGSPLVCPIQEDPSTYVQVGVVSWGLGCGDAGIPGVYAAVTEVVPWIQQVIQQNS